MSVGDKVHRSSQEAGITSQFLNRLNMIQRFLFVARCKSFNKVCGNALRWSKYLPSDLMHASLKAPLRNTFISIAYRVCQYQLVGVRRLGRHPVPYYQY